MDNQRKLTSITIVAPFYNEEQGAEIFHQTLCQHLDLLGIPYNFVFVDDGSHDNTLAILNRIADTDPRVTVLALSRNFGHQIALSAGLDYAEGEAVVVMDSDLQHPPSAIAEMVRAYESGAEIVYGVRNNDDSRRFLKRFVARQYYAFLQRATALRFVSGAADFRLISRRALLTLRTMREVHRYLRGMVPWLGYNYAVVYYEEQQRYAGTPQYTWRKSFRMARHGLFSFSTVPLDIITIIGVLLTVLAIIYLIYILVAAIAFGIPVPGWTSIIVVLLVVSGVQLISIGVIAQYIGMIFEQVKGRPLYVLKQERLQSAPFPNEEDNCTTHER